MTDPNSLFSNIIITICSKFGTGDWGATVGSVAVGIAGGSKVGKTGVDASVGEGKPDGTTVGGALVVQDANKMKTKIHRPKSFM
jgi:hypothetical protein